MKVSPEILVKQFEAFGPVSIKSMFGGYGVYYQGLMFGLVAGECLYLKVDEVSRPEFAEAGSTQFVYERQGRPIGMSYYSAPDEVFGEGAALLYWSSLAYDAALRAQVKKNGRGRKAKRKALFDAAYK